MPADRAKTPPPAWLAPDVRAVLAIQVQIGNEGTATRVRAQLWRRYRIQAEALYQRQERVGLEVPVSHDKYPAWLYAAEQEPIVEALLHDNPRDGLIRRLVTTMGLLRFVDSEFPEAIVNAELDTALAEIASEPQPTQPETDPALLQTERDAALAEIEPDPLQAEAKPDPGKPKRRRIPWHLVDPLIDKFLVEFGTPADNKENKENKENRRRLIKIAQGELATHRLRPARSTVEHHVDKRIAKRIDELR
jgi:hypothetical protein